MNLCARRLSFHAFACLVITALSAGAGAPFSQLPADTRWLVHVDAAAFRDTACGQSLIKTLADSPMGARLAAFQALSSINVTSDVDSVTLCGSAGPEQGWVGYLRGRWNVAHLSTLAAAAAKPSESKIGTRRVMRWVEKRGATESSRYACFAADGLLLMTDRESALRTALDVLDTTVPGLSGVAAFKSIESEQTIAPFVTILMRDGATLAGTNPRAGVLRQADALGLTLATDGRNLRLALDLRAVSEAAAAQIQSVVMGMQSVLLLRAQEMPEAVKLANALRLTTEGARMRATLQMPIDDLVSTVRAIQARRAAPAAAVQP